MQSLQSENLKLKEALADVIKRVREMVTNNVIEPIKKSNPLMYTEIKQLLDPHHKELEANGFVTFLQEREFFAALKFNLPPST